MNINTLMVMNSLHNLGLTEAEFEAIADEVSHTERTGFSIKAIKGDRVIGISHDDKENIVIKETIDFGRFELKPNTRILLKTLINFDELPEQIYALHRICQYRSLDISIKHTANNLEELKEKLCDRFTDKYDKVLLADESYWQEHSGWDNDKRDKIRKTRKEQMTEQLKAIYWLFNEPFNFKFKETPKNISVIVKVFSARNIRLAVIQEMEQFEKSRGCFSRNVLETCEGLKVRIQTFKPHDKRYDYVCEGREIYSNYGTGEVWVCDELIGKISDKEFVFLAKRVDEKCYRILTRELYELEKDSLRVEIMTARRKALEQQSKNKLITEIKKQFKEGSLTRQGITITPESLSYNGITIKGDKMKEFIAVEEIPMRETLDFHNLAISYVEYLLGKTKEYGYLGNDIQAINFQGKAKISIGKININIGRARGVFSVNGSRVRTDEVCEIILRALAFSNQQDYESWVKEASRESMRLKNALKNGITFKFEVEKNDDNCLIRNEGEFKFTLPLIKKDNKVYVSFYEKEYKVQDINALFDLQKEVDKYRIGNETLLGRAIKLLYRGIKDISPKEIGELIVISKKEHNERIERSRKFLENAIRLANAERVKDGWLVKGESGQEYLVGKDTSVYKVKDGEKDTYLCIMDTATYGESEAQENDRIAKRILGMRYDITVAKDLWELGDRVDKWWRDIQNKNFQEQIKQEQMLPKIEGMQQMTEAIK